MKVRLWILLGVLGVVFVGGCQRSASKADNAMAVEQGPAEAVSRVEKEADSAEEAHTRYRTVRTRNPETGEIITKQVPVKSTSDSKQTTRTVRSRDPQTGQIVTKEILINTEATSGEGDTQQTRTVRIRDPKTGRTVAKEVPVNSGTTRTVTSCDPRSNPSMHEEATMMMTQLSEGECETSWRVDCSVETVFDVIRELLYADLKLKELAIDAQLSGGLCDSLSAFLRAYSSSGITFDVRILLESPDRSKITITAYSQTQRRDVLQKHSLYLKDQISEAIAQKMEVIAESSAYPNPKEMVLDGTVKEIYDVLYQWAIRAGFDIQGRDQYDLFGGRLTCYTNSGIHLNFNMGLIEDGRTVLRIKADKFEGKGEFKMILKSLEDALMPSENQ